MEMDEIARKLEQSRIIRKELLKSAPIWEYEAKFGVDLEKLRFDIKCHNEYLNNLLKRVETLPRLNSTENVKSVHFPLERNENDVILYYYKNDKGDYVEDVMKNKELASDIMPIPNDQPTAKVIVEATSITESITMLEQKLKRDEEVFVMMSPKRPWIKCKVVYVYAKPTRGETMRRHFRVRVRLPKEHELKFSRFVDAEKYQVARVQDHKDCLKVTKRVIAGLTDTKLLPGIIGAEPHEDNKNRYLVLMDDGSASYFKPNQVYPILWQGARPWEDVRYLNDEDTFAYVRYYFGQYPRRHLLLARVGDELSLEREGDTVNAQVVGLDCDTVRLLYEDNTEESIYLGSPRFLKRNAVVQKQLANHMRSWDNYHNDIVMNCHEYHKTAAIALDEVFYQCLDRTDKKVILSGYSKNNTARKSSTRENNISEKVKITLDDDEVYENRDDIEQIEYDVIVATNKAHRIKCCPECLIVEGVKTELTIKDITAEFRHISDLKVPLLFGWKRKLICLLNTTKKGDVKKRICVIYEAPCGKILTQARSIKLYLSATSSMMDIDYFSFDKEIVLNRSLGLVEGNHYVENIACDSKTGLLSENKFISVLNQFTEEQLPVDFEYRNESFPHPLLLEKGFSFNVEFKSGCDCNDDCNQRSTCACHQLIEDFYGSNQYNKGTIETKCHYNHKRLYEQVGTGIFECNEMCSCSSKCPNRVVQNGIRFRLLVRKTLNKGWGVVTLDDIPKGAFICTYAAELLDDADQYGNSDMYYADLDYITVNEEKKLGNYEDDEHDEGIADNSEEDSESDESPPRGESEDALEATSSSSQDYVPQSRYPRRQAQYSTIQLIAAQQNGSKTVNSKQKQNFLRIHKILESRDFTLDARVRGNVGRFFNHSCDPNSFVQNVFINTHDLRFPHVAFFAQKSIKAMEEITWNYNYKMGCMEGRRIDCHCGASNCRGRIL